MTKILIIGSRFLDLFLATLRLRTIRLYLKTSKLEVAMHLRNHLYENQL
jgi:hypothetical protein